MKSISIRDLGLQLGPQKILDSMQLDLKSQELTAIVGGMGAGKTFLAKALCGRAFRTGNVYFHGFGPHPTLEWVPQQHRFKNRQNLQEFYLQQRFNSQDKDNAYTILEELQAWPEAEVSVALQRFGLWEQRHQALIQLSNGENKRLQILKALLSKPDFLILDNPYLGLDQEGRLRLDDALAYLKGLDMVLLLLSSPMALPKVVDHVHRLNQGKLFAVSDAESQAWTGSRVQLQQDQTAALQWLIEHAPAMPNAEVMVKMERVNIKYQDRVVLPAFDWEIRRGEQWALHGPNGAGKSTLISYITADNPQAYAQALTLFDRPRGSGESIWDIKRHIGYTSPEMHLYFKSSLSAAQVVGTGLLDTMGLYKELKPDQWQRIQTWFGVYGLAYLLDRPFHTLSTGQQKVVLLLRALVKNPALLILDEACQGLDDHFIALTKAVLDYLAQHQGNALIYVTHLPQDLPDGIQHHKHLR